MATSDLVTQKQAAEILNRSVSAVSRAIRDGRLEYIDSERRLLHRPGLEVRFRQTTRPRIDKPQRKSAKPACSPDSSRGDHHLAGLLAAVERQAQLRAGGCTCLLVKGTRCTSPTTIYPDD